jgi:hypothetical protein
MAVTIVMTLQCEETNEIIKLGSHDLAIELL